MKEITLNCQNGTNYKILVDEDSIRDINKRLWRAKFKDGRVYFVTTNMGKDIYLNRFIMGVYNPEIIVSYQDGNTLNNQKSNFVLVTKTHPVITPTTIIQTPKGPTQVRDSVVTITQNNSVSTAKVQVPESNDEIIERVCMEFIDDKKLFTSIDISNHIKKVEKQWIRNREVTAFLNSNWHLLTPHMVRVLISVNNGRENAWLYYEDDNDYEKYDGQNQKAITPDEFEEIKKN